MLYAVAIVAAAWPASALGAFPPELDTSGPFSAIDVSSDLGCQITVSGDSAGSFWGGNSFNGAGACGTWLALTPATGGGLYGPSVTDGPAVTSDFTASSETMSGSGTSASPYVITTVVDVPGGTGASPPPPLGTITETDTYIVGQSMMSTTITVQAAMSANGLAGTIYHAGECELAGNPIGYGAYVAQSGTVECAPTPGDSPAARVIGLTDVSPAASYFEGTTSGPAGTTTLWQATSGSAYNDTVASSTSTEYGLGLSWPVDLAAGASQTFQFMTQITPNVAPTSSTTAGPCTETGTIAITTDEPNGPGVLNYVVDSGATQVATVTQGQPVSVSVGTTAGAHTLTYWATDGTAEQEATHHTLAVTVEPNGPSVSIVSDQNATSYEQNETATISVTASGVDLSVDPTAAHVPISTATPGTFTVNKTATDGCGSSTASYTYTVIPPPALGQSVDLLPVSGTVLVELPATKQTLLDAPLQSPLLALTKGTGFIPLTQARQIPVGSIINTVAGIASVTSATNKKKVFYNGNFGAGVFQILQARKEKGLTRLNLMDTQNPNKVCASVGKKKAPAARGADRATIAKKLSTKVLALLNGNAHGGFATYGQYASATIQGTVFTIKNRCDGTLTKVTRGVVIVDDFRRHKTIRLTTGKSYLAKA